MRIPTRVAESSSNFEISGPAGLNVNMGIMLIAVVPSPLGHSSSTAVFWPLFAVVRTTYTDRWLRVWRWSRKTRRIWKSNFFYDFHAQERSESSSRKAIPSVSLSLCFCFQLLHACRILSLRFVIPHVMEIIFYNLNHCMIHRLKSRTIYVELYSRLCNYLCFFIMLPNCVYILSEISIYTF